MSRTIVVLIVVGVIAGLGLCGIPSLAQTSWDVVGSFSTISSPGAWSYGYANAASLPGSYTFTAFTANVHNYHDSTAGFRWLSDATTVNWNGDPSPMIGIYAGTSVYWIFRQPPTPPGYDLYALANSKTNQACIFRWTAPTSGSYTFAGHMAEANSGHADNYWVVNYSSSYTTLLSGTVTTAQGSISLASAAPISMNAGASLDFIVGPQQYERSWTRFDMVVSSSGPPPAGAQGFVQDSGGSRLASATVSDGGNVATTASDGTYTLPIATPGTYTITASKSGYTPQSVAGVVIGATGTVTVNLTLQIPGSGAQTSAGMLPDMKTIPAPSPEPSLPSSFDAFAPPVYSAAAAPNTPAFAEWTRTGAPDDTIVGTGDQFSSFTGTDQGKDSRFMVYGQTSSTDSTLIPAKIQRLDGLKTALTIDSGMPSWSMYLVWPKNSNGYGYPIAVNKTEAWWLGPKLAEKGSIVAVYGRNLSNDNGTSSSWVYLKRDSNTVVPLTVTSVNPYRVAFTVPSDLADGNYEVWIHNGHGGHYGWSGPLTLQVFTRHAWSGPVINVKSSPYNATGDGSTNDTNAIDAALGAATPYSTVYFPAGTYMVTGPVSNAFPSNVKILGDGMDSSSIKLISGTSMVQQGAARTNIEIDNITLDNNNLSQSGNFIYMTSVSDLHFNSSRLKCNRTYVCNISGGSGVFFTNCEIIHGSALFFGNEKQIFIDNCHFRATNDAEGCVGGWGNVDTSITNCTVADYDNTQSSGWGEGRFYIPGGNGGAAHDTYLGNNTTTDMTPQASADQNSGEQMLWEGGLTHWRGAVVSADATHATFASAPSGTGNNDAVIVRGKGLGQYRSIASTSGNTITLATPWNVIPDSTSQIIMESAFDKVVVYKNYIDAKPNAAASGGTGTGPSCMGVDPDGGCYDFVVDGNTFHQTRYGIMDTGYADNDILPNYFLLFTNNILDSNRYPAAIVLSYNGATVTNPDPDVNYLGHIFRRNSVVNQVLSGSNTFPVAFSVFGSWPWAGPAVDMLVIEHNTVTNTGTGIDTSLAYTNGISSVGNLIAYKNTFTHSASASTSIGIKAGTGESLALRENIWTGFASNYSGSSLGAVLEAPQRCFAVIGSAGRPAVTTQLVLWNSGTSSMSWTASDDAAWLNESSGLATITGEGLFSTLTLTCDPTGLAPGTYTGTMTASGASQTKKMTILFTVCSPYVNATKQTADRSPVSIVSGVVSAVFGNCLYVQTVDRSCGIRVDASGTGLAVGMNADVTGTITTDSNGERRIFAGSTVRNGTDTSAVLPLLVTNQTIGGGDYYYSSSTGAGQKGIAGSSGLNNVGLLVRTTGQASYVDPAGAFAYLDDGSGATDGNTLGAGGTAVPGVRVIPPSGVPWPSGSYIGVTGVSTLTTVAGTGARAIEVRTSDDISVLL